MAFISCGMALSRFSLRIRPVSKFHTNSTLLRDSAIGSTTRSSIPCARTPTGSTSVEHSAKSFLGNRSFVGCISRSPSELACVQSLLPLHSVTAAARLVSHLSLSAGEAPTILHDLSSLKPR